MGIAAKSAMAVQRRVLVVEDEADIREVLEYNLKREATTSSSPGRPRRACASRRAAARPRPARPDAPRRVGTEAAQAALDPTTRGVRVLVLTAKSEEVDRVIGFEIGADDYVVKPFSVRELLLRVNALLRRAHLLAEPESAGLYERGRLKIDFDSYQVYVEGKRKELALREFELLRFLVQHPMRVYNREQLLDKVWGRDTFVEPRTVDVHVRRLRKHIERDDANPELILTVRSVGYRFNPDALG